MEFALDGLRKDLSLAARCSSALDLAVQCSTPSFRANLRAHGFISKIFGCLQDAPSNKVRLLAILITKSLITSINYFISCLCVCIYVYNSSLFFLADFGAMLFLCAVYDH